MWPFRALRLSEFELRSSLGTKLNDEWYALHFAESRFRPCSSALPGEDQRVVSRLVDPALDQQMQFFIHLIGGNVKGQKSFSRGPDQAAPVAWKTASWREVEIQGERFACANGHFGSGCRPRKPLQVKRGFIHLRVARLTCDMLS